MADNVSEVLQLLYQIRYDIGIAELCYFLLGVPMQIFVIYLCIRVFRRTGHKNQLIVLSMTFADLLFSGIHSPMMYGLYATEAVYPTVACYGLYFATYIGTISSSLSLLMLNFDKFLYLHKPLHYGVIVTRRKTVLGIITLWIISISWALLFLLGPATAHDPEKCGFRPHILEVYAAFFIIFFTLPIIISFATSVYIGILVIRTQRFKRERAASQAGFRSTFNLRNRRKVPLARKMRRKKSDISSSLKSILFVFNTTIWAVLTVLPYRVSYILYQSGLLAKTDWSTKLMTSMYLFAIMAFNPVGNPFITIITQRSYVEAVKSLICCCNTSNYRLPETTKVTLANPTGSGELGKEREYNGSNGISENQVLLSTASADGEPSKLTHVTMTRNMVEIGRKGHSYPREQSAVLL